MRKKLKPIKYTRRILESEDYVCIEEKLTIAGELEEEDIQEILMIEDWEEYIKNYRLREE